MKKIYIKTFILLLCFSLILLSGCNRGTNNNSSDNSSAPLDDIVDARPHGEALSADEKAFEKHLYEYGFYSFTEEDFPTLSFNKPMSIYGEKSINIIGDSIAHGMNSGAIYNNSWVVLFKNSVNKTMGSNNYGYVSMFDALENSGNKEIHSVSSESGSWTTKRHVTSTPGYATVTSNSPADSSLLIKIDRKADTYDRHINGFYIYYVSGSSYGGFDVTVNGQKVYSVAAGGTNDNTARTEYIAIPDGMTSVINIRIVKTDSSPVTISGIAYAESDSGVMINNYSLSGMTLTELDDDLLRNLCKSNYVIFCLGYNDAGSSQDITIFKQKLKVVSDACNEYGSTLIIADYIWPKGSNTSWATKYKNELFNCAKNANGYYINFYDMYKINSEYLLSDAAHPTPAGHKLIARKFSYFFGVPFNSNLD